MGPELKLSHGGQKISISDLPYIGYTKNFKNRIKEEVSESILNYFSGDLSRAHEKAILMALRKECEQVITFILKIDSNSGIDPVIGDFDDVCRWFSHKKLGTRMGRNFMNFILSEKVLKKYYDFRVIAAFESSAEALKREKVLTKSFKHKVGGKEVLGTIWPNGLNMIAGGGGVQTGAVDVIDIIEVMALSSLGLHLTTIAQILSKAYGKKITKNSLSEVIRNSEFKSFEKIQEIALRPVVWSLIIDTTNEGFTYNIHELVEMFNFDYLYLTTRIENWFGEKLRNLRNIIKAGCTDFVRIKEFSDEVKSVFRGYSPEQVKEWYIDARVTKDIMGEHFGVGAPTIDSITKKISRALTDEGIELNRIKLTNYLRKKEAIELLKQGWHPEEILDQRFHLNIWMEKPGKKYVRKQRVRYYFEKIFEGMILEGVINAYSNNPSNELSRYESGSVIFHPDFIE